MYKKRGAIGNRGYSRYVATSRDVKPVARCEFNIGGVALATMLRGWWAVSGCRCVRPEGKPGVPALNSGSEGWRQSFRWLTDRSKARYA